MIEEDKQTEVESKSKIVSLNAHVEELKEDLSSFKRE
jgi:hypothetical protein